MGQQESKSRSKSKDELLYEKAKEGDVEAVKALRSEGAGLEWVDEDGWTPLIAACLSPEPYMPVKALIQLGANINAFHRGCGGGTPLHIVAKRGLGWTASLLLSHGAKLVRNNYGDTPLDVARSYGHTNVVRAIESHICFFSGWVREFYGPGFLNALAPQLLSTKIWIVVVPLSTYEHLKPLKLGLWIYSTLQDARARVTVDLWRADVQEPNFDQPDPRLVIFDKSTKTQYKFAASVVGDKQQIQSFYLACRGFHQTNLLPAVRDTQIAGAAMKSATRINASIQSAMEDKSIFSVDHVVSRTSKAKDTEISSSSCRVCWEAPVEAACIPCGHMACCMSCLNTIKTKKGDCPVCRAKMRKVIRIYAV